MAAGTQKNTARNRALIFIDEGNLTGICGKLNIALDWHKLRDAISAGKEVIEIMVFAGLPPSIPEWAEIRQKRERFLHWLETEGFLVVRRHGKPTSSQAYKADIHVMMAVEAAEMCLEIRPETAVLATGDGDMGFLACRLRRHGIRVEVAAFEQNLSDELKISANGFIDLAKVFGASESRRHPREPHPEPTSAS